MNLKSGSARGSADISWPACIAAPNIMKLACHFPRPHQAPNQASFYPKSTLQLTSLNQILGKCFERFYDFLA